MPAGAESQLVRPTYSSAFAMILTPSVDETQKSSRLSVDGGKKLRSTRRFPLIVRRAISGSPSDQSATRMAFAFNIGLPSRKELVPPSNDVTPAISGLLGS